MNNFVIILLGKISNHVQSSIFQKLVAQIAAILMVVRFGYHKHFVLIKLFKINHAEHIVVRFSE
jgi:hypothetical protein